MVIRATTTGRPWHDTVVDLRVDDSADPVAALADLLVTRARYQDVVRAFQQAIDGDPVTADRELELLRPMDPVTEPDQLMWRAVVAALAGREDAAREMLIELGASRAAVPRGGPPVRQGRPDARGRDRSHRPRRVSRQPGGSLAILRNREQDRGVTDGDPELDPRRWLALAVCVSALFITLLDVSIVNVALPSIGRGLGADASELQWVVSGYALAFGMVPIIGGRLGDDRGRKPMLLSGIAAFVVFSALVGLAPTPGVIIVGRVLQGLAGGLLNPQVSGIVQQLFPPDERGKAFGAIGRRRRHRHRGRPGGRRARSSPSVGAEFGWRLCFLVNVPVGHHLAVPAAARLLPPTPARESTPRRSTCPAWPCSASASSACCSRRSSSTPTTTCGWRSSSCSRRWRVLAGFVAWERGPAAPPRASADRPRACSASAPTPTGVVLALLFFCAYTGTPLVLALFLQEGLGFSAAALRADRLGLRHRRRAVRPDRRPAAAPARAAGARRRAGALRRRRGRRGAGGRRSRGQRPARARSRC